MLQQIKEEMFVYRFPGFILPCLGVHPVQEDPAQPRGALPEVLAVTCFIGVILA